MGMMAFTQAQVDVLEAAIASGALEVRYGDKLVRYQSASEMKATLRRMKLELGQIQPEAKIFPKFSKGF
jgi:hypothetical protein